MGRNRGWPAMRWLMAPAAGSLIRLGIWKSWRSCRLTLTFCTPAAFCISAITIGSTADLAAVMTLLSISVFRRSVPVFGPLVSSAFAPVLWQAIFLSKLSPFVRSYLPPVAGREDGIGRILTCPSGCVKLELQDPTLVFIIPTGQLQHELGISQTLFPKWFISYIWHTLGVMMPLLCEVVLSMTAHKRASLHSRLSSS